MLKHFTKTSTIKHSEEIHEFFALMTFPYSPMDINGAILCVLDISAFCLDHICSITNMLYKFKMRLYI